VAEGYDKSAEDGSVESAAEPASVAEAAGETRENPFKVLEQLKGSPKKSS
jgi:hypothetical protein